MRQIKERFCYVACDPKLEQKLAYETCVLEQAYQVCGVGGGSGAAHGRGSVPLH